MAVENRLSEKPRSRVFLVVVEKQDKKAVLVVASPREKRSNIDRIDTAVIRTHHDLSDQYPEPRFEVIGARVSYATRLNASSSIARQGWEIARREQLVLD